jgi:hypothetical protein
METERKAREQLVRLVDQAVKRMRDTADQIEREARSHIASAAKDKRFLEFQTYGRVAGQAILQIQTLVFNLDLENLIDAAADAEAARTERKGRA